MFRIAIAAEHDYTDNGRFGPWYDDRRLQSALQARGHQVEIIDWEDTELDVLSFDSIFVSSTWNACDYPQQYISWLNNCESDNQQRLINAKAVIAAGFTKYRYWGILEQILARNPAFQELGRLTPSRFYQDANSPEDGVVQPLAGRKLSDILAELDQNPLWNRANIVIKPVISADGKDTFVYNRFGREIPIDEDKRAQFVLDHADEANAIFHRLATDLNRKGVLLQTYMSGVEEGEYSLIMLDQKCTHAIQKPKLFKGDSSSRRRFMPLDQLPDKMLRFAENIVEQLDNEFGSGSVSRARVDLFFQQGTPVLCELECVEPNTNIRIVANHNEEMANQILQTYVEVIEKRTAALSS
ncbi:MAG: RimK family alpha-L-glutamate ligase [Leptolyngbyaceae cyanobacterium]